MQIYGLVCTYRVGLYRSNKQLLIDDDHRAKDEQNSEYIATSILLYARKHIHNAHALLKRLSSDTPAILNNTFEPWKTCPQNSSARNPLSSMYGVVRWRSLPPVAPLWPPTTVCHMGFTGAIALPAGDHTASSAQQGTHLSTHHTHAFQPQPAAQQITINITAARCQLARACWSCCCSWTGRWHCTTRCTTKGHQSTTGAGAGARAAS